MNTLLPSDRCTLLEKIYQTVPNGVYILDLQTTKVLWINDRVNPLYGYTLMELQALKDNYVDTLVHPDDISAVKSAFAKAVDLKEGDVLSMEYRFKDRQGSYRWINDRITVFARSEDGKVTAILGVACDSTKEVQTELEISEAKMKMLSSTKMAALGEMSASIAHEINNPLTVIQARAYQLLQIAEASNLNPEKIKQAAESINRTADKIARIIKSLRTFSHEGTSDPFEVVAVKKIIDETLEFCRTRFYNHGIEIEISPFEEDLEVECRIVQIQQVLLNLLNNSFDAIETQESKWIRILVEEQDEMIEISVIDSGPGIPEHLVEQIMLPFFTTKEAGKGTGLGLSISSGILKSHKGNLIVKSAKPATTMTMQLPRLQDAQNEGLTY